MEKQIVAVTESSDKVFHFTRVAIYSFIQTNKWFDGPVYVLTSKESPLSIQNHNILKTIYSKIDIVEVSDLEFNELISSIKKKNSQYQDLITSSLFYYIFKLDVKGALYFSNNTLFMNSIDGILNPDKISASIESNEFPAVSEIAPINTSLIYVPEKILTQNHYSKLLSRYKEKELTPQTHKEVFNSYFDDISSFNKISNVLVAKSSNFQDTKYSVFLRHSKSVRAVEYNTINSNLKSYGRIHAVWMQKNSELGIFLSKPSSFDSAFISKKISEGVMPVSKNIKRLFDQDLKFNSGESINSKKLALCTICNDDFAIGAKTMIHSFLVNNSWFTNDIIVFHNTTYSPISESNKNEISSLYNKIIFKEVDEKAYHNLIKKFVSSGRNPKRFIPSLFTFEAFDLAKEYDRVLYLDSDMLVMKDISELFSLTSKIAVTPDAGVYDIRVPYTTFNGGFLVIDKSTSQSDYRNKLLDAALRMRDLRLADQSVMNAYFINSVEYLDSRYNCLKRCFPDERFSKFDENIKILHFVGAKPWHKEKIANERRYTKLESIWNEYYSLTLAKI